MKCLVCLEEVKQDEHGSFLDALYCTTNGNYGSTIFDPMDFLRGEEREFLAFVIHDKCIIQRGEHVDHVLLKRREVEHDKQPFLDYHRKTHEALIAQVEEQRQQANKKRKEYRL